MSLARLMEGGRVERAHTRIFSEEARSVRGSVDNGGCGARHRAPVIYRERVFGSGVCPLNIYNESCGIFVFSYRFENIRRRK